MPKTFSRFVDRHDDVDESEWTSSRDHSSPALVHRFRTLPGSPAHCHDPRMARPIPAPEEQQQAAAAAWWASPIGQANLARNRGDGFFQTEIPHQSIVAQDRWWTTIASPTKTRTTEHGPRTDLLSEIEAQGWKLEHVNFVYIPTGEVTRDRQFMAGSSTAISEHTIGIYLFRSVA